MKSYILRAVIALVMGVFLYPMSGLAGLLIGPVITFLGFQADLNEKSGWIIAAAQIIGFGIIFYVPMGAIGSIVAMCILTGILFFANHIRETGNEEVD